MKSVSRWIYTINVIRALSYMNIDNEHLNINGIKCKIVYHDETTCDIICDKTGEILMTFSEEGWPLYLSDWARQPMEWDADDYAMYELEV